MRWTSLSWFLNSFPVWSSHSYSAGSLSLTHRVKWWEELRERGEGAEQITTNAFGQNRPTPFDNILKSFVTRLNVMVVLEVIELGRAFSRTSEKEREWEKEIHTESVNCFSLLSHLSLLSSSGGETELHFSLWPSCKFLNFFCWRIKFCAIFHRLSSNFFAVFAIRQIRSWSAHLRSCHVRMYSQFLTVRVHFSRNWANFWLEFESSVVNLRKWWM